jgi:hypothetical protein
MWDGHGMRMAAPPHARHFSEFDVARLGTEPRSTDRQGVDMYEKPEVKRFGSLRELTQGGGPAGGGDATNVYHRS